MSQGFSGGTTAFQRRHNGTVGYVCWQGGWLVGLFACLLSPSSLILVSLIMSTLDYVNCLLQRQRSLESSREDYKANLFSLVFRKVRNSSWV